VSRIRAAFFPTTIAAAAIAVAVIAGTPSVTSNPRVADGDPGTTQATTTPPPPPMSPDSGSHGWID
jgi:hypothetical protein